MPNTPIQPVIMSGGSGTRLWPMSRQNLPKQFLPLVSARSMFQETVLRLDSASPSLKSRMLDPIVIANDCHKDIIERQLNEIGASAHALVLEPFGRNTAPVAAVAARLTAMRDPSALILLLAADHHIEGQSGFDDTTLHAAAAAAKGYLTTFGIVATHPETGYGYVRRGAPLPGLPDVFAVAQFVEKPQRAVAERYLASGDYYWNSGMFLMNREVLEAELERWRGDILEAATAAITKGQWTGRALALDPAAFGECPSESIDYAVMEKTDRASVVPAHFRWNDVGSWQALWDIGERDAANNVSHGDVIAGSAQRNYLRAESRVLAVLGVDDLVIVETGDAVLVAHRDKVQDIKSIVSTLDKQGRREVVRPVSEVTTYGTRRVVDSSSESEVALLSLETGRSLELAPAPAVRAVTVLSGELAALGRTLRAGETLNLPAGARASLSAQGQTGTRLLLSEIRVSPGAIAAGLRPATLR